MNRLKILTTTLAKVNSLDVVKFKFFVFFWSVSGLVEYLHESAALDINNGELSGCLLPALMHSLTCRH